MLLGTAEKGLTPSSLLPLSHICVYIYDTPGAFSSLSCKVTAPSVFLHRSEFYSLIHPQVSFFFLFLGSWGQIQPDYSIQHSYPCRALNILLEAIEILVRCRDSPLTWAALLSIYTYCKFYLQKYFHWSGSLPDFAKDFC